MSIENTGYKVKTYRNITEFLLFFVRERPGMYLGESKLSKLQNFITGYQIGFSINNVENDYYFGNNGFFEWYCHKYNKGPYSFWEAPFMEEAKDDEKKALQIYFKYLLKFYNERNQK